jgi:hypothetical protein
MNVRDNRPVIKRLTKDQRKPVPRNRECKVRKWELADDRVDEALRQTFPASDALSIIQNVRES